MQDQIKTNKEMLLDEAWKISNNPMNVDKAQRLNICMKAHKNIQELCELRRKGALGWSDEESGTPKFCRRMAIAWVSGMKNADGTTGQHWSMEQTEQLLEQRGLMIDPTAFWVAMNAVYSDLSPTLKKYGITSVDAYVDIARAFWFDDTDAVPDKLAAYYEYVVER